MKVVCLFSGLVLVLKTAHLQAVSGGGRARIVMGASPGDAVFVAKALTSNGLDQSARLLHLHTAHD
ncbi:hypothetical protein KIN20_020652 [Parelaphostrongylus tenuis]|uniref:Uncharacterized protein n=1 Tax=Parelaphostrongylus tenuis TaxID=148309 RepID=A0AAD5QVP0_PARTN|nr:hypothetical protein KIN20_020652 [Parelaphostrongylus tenuis]